MTFRIPHRHLRLAVDQRRPIHRPVHTVVVSNSFIRTEPRTFAVKPPHLVGKVGRQTAIFSEKVMPVSTVVSAISKVSSRPQDVIHIADRSNNLVDKSLVFEK